MRATEFINEDISMSELQAVERFADSLWKKLGINVDFSRHFLERVNDERNGKPISAAELVRIFKKEYERYGKKIADAENHEAVMKDLLTKINLPFVITDRYDHREMVAKTIMRKDNFLNSNPEYVVQEEELDEIERLRPDAYTGGKESLYDKQYGKRVKKLPGGSGLLYSTSEGRWEGIDIKIWDPNGKEYLAQKNKEQEPKPERQPREPKRDYEYRLYSWERAQRDLNVPGQLIGKLTVSNAKYFPLKGAVQVDTITVDEDYRGVGLAKALYGIVLTIMKRPLLAGSSQTPGGRRNWVSLASIPGVEMKGYIQLDNDDINPSADRSPYADTTSAQANKNIDIIMGKLGGQHLGTSRGGDEFFAFDVQPNTTKTELEAYVNTKLSQVYGSYHSDSGAGLYAVWTGQA